MINGATDLFVVSLVVFLSGLLSCAKSEPQKAECGLFCCVVELPLLRTTDGFDKKWLGGDPEAIVVADFVVSSSGKATDIRVFGPTPLGPTPQIRNKVISGLTESTFKSVCQGRRLRVRYDLKVLPLPVAADLPAISLRADDTISMTFAERQPPSPLMTVRPGKQ